MKSLASVLVFAAIVCGLVSAINIIKPINAAIVDGASYDLGSMGPGQAMSVLISRTETTGGKFGTGGYFDYANATDLPAGWNMTPSQIYGNPLQIVIISGADAANGNYTIPIKVYDYPAIFYENDSGNNSEGLGDRMFLASIHIDDNVLGLGRVSGTSYAGENQPVRFTMKLENRGNAGDIFVIEGVSFKQRIVREIYVAPESETLVPFEFVYQGSGPQTVNFTAYSKNSPARVRKSLSYPVMIRNTLQADLSSMGYGVVIFPLFEHGSYALGHLLSYLLG
jgi:hypothetical protein